MRLQCVTILSATLIASSVAAFRDNPLKKLVDFSGTWA